MGDQGFSGAKGNVHWVAKTSLPVNVHSWSCDMEHSALDVTPFSPLDDAGVFVPMGIIKWSGSFDLWFDRVEDIETTEIIGAACWLYLKARGDTNTLVGYAICETVSITTPADGPITVTVNFRGTKELTVTWPPTTTGVPTTTVAPTTAPPTTTA